MRREDRAKQFLPFDAMKGLSAAMKREEERLARVERIDLGEEDAAALSDALSHTVRGDKITVTFYQDGAYQTLRGTVTAFDEIKRTLTVEDQPISFDDVIILEKVKEGK